MPPKKKTAKQDDDDPTPNILRFYRKKCEINGITVLNKQFKDKVEAVVDETLPLEKVPPKKFFLIKWETYFFNKIHKK